MKLTVHFKNGNKVEMKVWNAGLNFDGNLQFVRKDGNQEIVCWKMKEIVSFYLEEEE